MTIRIELTRRQHKQLRKHFAMINIASRVGQKGIFVAQVEQTPFHDGAYVRAHFFPGDLSEPIAEAVRTSKIPNCWVGVPPSHTSNSCASEKT